MNIGFQFGGIGESVIYAAMQDLDMMPSDLIWITENINSKESNHFFSYVEENFMHEIMHTKEVGDDCN